MDDRPAETAPNPPRGARDAAAGAVARLHRMAPDLRGCAVLGPGGEPLAASGPPGRWARAAAALLDAADAAAARPASHVHVSTEDGEAFAVREGGLAIVAVAERLTLASLILFDMRSVLRDVVRASPGEEADAPAADAASPAGAGQGR